MAKILSLFCLVVVVLCLANIARAEQDAEVSDSTSGVFSGTFGDALWTVIAFTTLLIVLGRVAWRPLLDNLNARQSHIEQQLKSAEESRQRAEHMLADYKEQGLSVVRQATEEAQQYQQQAAERTRQDALAMRRRAQEEIESTRAAAVEQLWQQTGDIVLRVSSEVLARALTEQDNQRLIDEAVAKIRQSGDRR
jgi:F-type H+-transporting ATPase subunit b